MAYHNFFCKILRKLKNLIDFENGFLNQLKPRIL